MGQYKYKSKKITESPEDNLPKVDKKGKFNVGDSKSEDGIKSTIVDIDKETGGIKWDIEYLPNFDKLFDGATELVNTAKGVYTKAKTDNKLRLIYDEARTLRNKIRTHIRNEYPEEYRRMTMKMTEGELDEMSTTGGGAGAASFSSGTGGQYATPFAFRKKGQKADDKAYKELGYKAVKEYTSEYDPATAKRNMFAASYNKEGDTERFRDYMQFLTKLKDSGQTNMFGAAPYLQQAFDLEKKEARELLAYWMGSYRNPDLDESVNESHTDAENKKIKVISKELKAASKMHKDQAKKLDKITKENIGADLGPGPKASEDGVKDNAYVKQFAYKLVPKKIKGSGIIVKQLFEKEEEEKKNFQLKRIEAFDGVEKKLNDIYTTISNAKNQTIEYYKENPDSYKVFKPTDLVMDYLEDIKKLLK